MSQIFDYLDLTRLAHQTPTSTLAMRLDTALSYGQTLITERRVVPRVWGRYTLLIACTRQRHSEFSLFARNVHGRVTRYGWRLVNRVLNVIAF